MYISNIKITNFKNIPFLGWQPQPGINLITGSNGVGKTNFLDAIYSLCMTKSAFNVPDLALTRYGNPFFVIESTIEDGSENKSVAVLSWHEEQKKNMFWNGKQYGRLSDHLGKIPVVLIQPNDSDTIRLGADLRRKTFDQVFSQFDQDYLKSLQRYQQLLQSKTKVLQHIDSNHKADEDLLDIYDNELTLLNKTIASKRMERIEDLRPLVIRNYALLEGGLEKVDIKYLSEVDSKSIRNELVHLRRQDIAAGRCTWGIHRDDYAFLFENELLRKVGSQGQQKTYNIALKLALYELLSKYNQSKPLLLLDDVFDKLDDNRIQKLIARVNGEDIGQVFITDARPERSKDLLSLVTTSIGYLEIKEMPQSDEKI